MENIATRGVSPANRAVARIFPAGQRWSDAFPLLLFWLRACLVSVFGAGALAMVGGCDANHVYPVRAYNWAVHSPAILREMPEWLRRECAGQGEKRGVFREVKAAGYYMSTPPSCTGPYPGYGCYQDLMGGGFAFVEQNINEFGGPSESEKGMKLRLGEISAEDAGVWRYSVEKVGHPDCANYAESRAQYAKDRESGGWTAPPLSWREYLVSRNVDPDFEEKHCIAVRKIPEVTARYELGAIMEDRAMGKIRGIPRYLQSQYAYVKDRQTGEYVSRYAAHKYTYWLHGERHDVTSEIDGRGDWCPMDFSYEEVYRKGLSPLNSPSAERKTGGQDGS